MNTQVETIVIGGGQAGLATSYYLRQRGREHIVLEQADQAGNAWRNGRWDSFTLNTPNWTLRIPGAEYQGKAPDSFMTRSEIVRYFEEYVRNYRLPVCYGVQVNSVEYNPETQKFLVSSGPDSWETRHVVMATGLFQQAKIPIFASEISPDITQLSSGNYRNPLALPPGAVLVVGSAQSGCQIAEELYQAGRKVYLSTGRTGRAPRRYRGRDVVGWLDLIGFWDRTVEQLQSPEDKFLGSLQVSGLNGGHALNLHQFSRDDVVLLGKLNGARSKTVWLESNLKENLAYADRLEADLTKMIDSAILNNGVDAPMEELPQLHDGYDQEEITALNLQDVGIKTIIWAMGYEFDFKQVKLPVLDGSGYPLQKRGVTGYPGLFFVGLPWLSKLKSGLLYGVGEDAEYIASKIDERKPM